MADEPHHEIVIIRRGGHGDHDDHHGGAWKVAFADFMTALMAFFLVMWLISANDKTKAVIAKYFNPVKLVDATISPKGLHDLTAGEHPTANASGTKKSEDVKDATGARPDPISKPETSTAKTERLDSEMRTNPLAALAEIASTKGSGSEGKVATQAPAPVIGRVGGDAFRDPFAPPPPPPPGTVSDEDPDLMPQDQTAQAEPAQADASAAQAAPRKAMPVEGDAVAAKEKPQTAKAEAGAKAEAAKQAEARKQEANSVLTALKSAASELGGPQIDVQRTSEGLVVSLTDTETFTMFGNGSAVPDKRVLTMMEKVADVLKKRPGAIIVRGFTDNKQYKSHRYDNWHLSIDRAQAAHYMLLRGGLDDARIERIEGRADRGAKQGIDPSSPINRRIEILVRDPV